MAIMKGAGLCTYEIDQAMALGNKRFAKEVDIFADMQ